MVSVDRTDAPFNSDGKRRGRRFNRNRVIFAGSILLLLTLITIPILTLLLFHASIDGTMAPTHPMHESPKFSKLRASKGKPEFESVQEMRRRLPPSIWSLAGRNSDASVTEIVSSRLTLGEKEKANNLCGKLLYSSIIRAVQVWDMGEQTFVSTGDIDNMWTRDSAVQMGIYIGRMKGEPFLRLIIEGAIRRQAFNIIQDPYANAYTRKWQDPSGLPARDRVIGRGGWVATRNYELDSGAYFLIQLYDYYVADGLYKPEKFLDDSLIFDAVMLLVDVWITEQRHDEQSPYSYFELPQNGKGPPTAYTGMTWTGFRPSDDPCTYGYLVPSNIYAAAALERTLELNKRVWRSDELDKKATQLLKDIENGIRQHGVVKTGFGERFYAYEVDGKGGVLKDFDDANVPSLLSIPLLGWSGYDKEVYRNTRKRILDPKTNKFYYKGEAIRGVGSPHTRTGFVWPMSVAIEALTTEGTPQQVAESLVFQLRQSLAMACKDAMHESVSSTKGCKGGYSREWFEWANALFVVLTETALGRRCDAAGKMHVLKSAVPQTAPRRFHSNAYQNNFTEHGFYLGIESLVRHYE